jgi:putative endonuclease
VDLIARDGTALCFIEVRSVTSERWGGAAASIDRDKRRRIVRAARWYLAAHPTAGEIRFDVVAITWRGTAPPAVDVIPSAFEADPGVW